MTTYVGNQAVVKTICAVWLSLLTMEADLDVSQGTFRDCQCSWAAFLSPHFQDQ